MKSYTARDVMTREVLTFTPETDLYDAMRALLSNGFSGAPVVDEAGNLVGIISEKDCLRVLASEAFDGFPEGRVADYMSRDPVAVSPATSIFDIVALFLNHQFRRLPVIDEDDHPVGQISRRDALRAIESMHARHLEPPVEYEPEGIEGPPGVSTAMARARAL